MEQNFFRDGFENLLKEQADNFRMYPSRRVWNSIYNDLYPGRRWPSLTVMLLLVFSLIYIGITHSHQIITATEKNKPGNEKTAVINNNASLGQNSYAVNYRVATLAGTINEPLIENISESRGDLHKPERNNNLSSSENQASQRNKRTRSGNHGRSSLVVTASVAENDFENTPESTSGAERNAPVEIHLNESTGTSSTDDAILHFSAIAPQLQNNVKADPQLRLVSLDIITNLPKDNSEKEWIENFAFHNKPLSKKWKTNIDYMAWATPSVGYRSLKANRRYEPSARIALLAPLGNGENEPDLVHNPAMNFEAGLAARFNKTKNIVLKLGVQFNYTNYTVRAYELNHTTATSLMLNDVNTGAPYLVSRSSSLANIEGLASQHVNNNSFQLSVPMGLDIRLAGLRKIQWYAGADVQPGIVFGGQSLLISADRKNYIADNGFRRKWNLNSGIESYVTYQTPSGITLLAGPQIRYQLFSTYNSQYSYKENLYNLGLKIGLIKKF
jgi:hypothetical protein